MLDGNFQLESISWAFVVGLYLLHAKHWVNIACDLAVTVTAPSIEMGTSLPCTI